MYKLTTKRKQRSITKSFRRSNMNAKYYIYLLLIQKDR